MIHILTKCLPLRYTFIANTCGKLLQIWISEHHYLLKFHIIQACHLRLLLQIKVRKYTVSHQLFWNSKLLKMLVFLSLPLNFYNVYFLLLPCLFYTLGRAKWRLHRKQFHFNKSQVTTWSRYTVPKYVSTVTSSINSIKVTFGTWLPTPFSTPSWF